MTQARAVLGALTLALGGLVALYGLKYRESRRRQTQFNNVRLNNDPQLRTVQSAEAEDAIDASPSSHDSKEDIDAGTFGRDRRLATQNNALRQQVDPSVDSLAFVKYILSNIIGENSLIETCFGSKRVVYCDWTGSAKALKFVEDYISSVVLPLYANTHSLESRMGLQTSCFREEAREIIQLACNANRKKDVVVFVGNGSTGAIQKMVDVLGLSGFDGQDDEADCVVFIGPHEHTSNLVIWRESRAKVVQVPERPDGSGKLNTEILQELLRKYSGYKLRIGSFSACSNVTGVLEDVDAVTVLLHKNGALAFWDYASAGPYCNIDMNPVSTGDDRAFLQRDAVFISTHKFVGGVGGTGVLIAKKSLFNNKVPLPCGGGTVYFVDEDSHRFLSDVASREEGGTPNIVGAIRAGLAFKIKQAVGTKIIAQLEERIVGMAREAFAEILGTLVLVGPLTHSSEASVLPTFSFLIRRHGRFLHHNFIVALLSDLYGIQCRGGCLCAGPYVQTLLGMDPSSVAELEGALVGTTHEREQFRPGVTRISIPYFFDEERIKYVLNAIRDVAMHGWRLLPLYRFENSAGEWGYRSQFQKFPQRRWLADFLSQNQPIPSGAEVSLTKQRDDALAVLLSPPQEALKIEGPRSEEDLRLRWFLAPWEASAELRGEIVAPPVENLVKPEKYLEVVVSQCKKALSHEPGNTKAAPVCELPSKLTRRDSKQPKRTISREQSGIRQERTQALLETANRHSSLAEQMSTAELFPTVPSKIMKPIVQASKEWSMINPGDRLLLGLSGGKDSLCLLHALIQIQRRAPFRFEIACCTIDPGAGDAFNPAPLIQYVESLGIKYHFESTDIFENARNTLGNAASYCSFCARMKRGTLYRVARENGYTALVLAQHLDDLVESFFMSAIRNGNLRTMKANYVEQKGEVRVIRPLCYVRERDTRDFSYAAKLPVINENCPACFAAPTERERIKQFLKDQEALIPNFFESVRKAILPLMDGNIYPVMQSIDATLNARRGENAATKGAKAFGAAKGAGKKKSKPGGDLIDAVDEGLDF